MLNPIQYLEETTGGAVKVRINNSEFWMPSSWYILVTDLDTYQLDTVSIQDCAKKKHVAFSFSPNEMNLRTLDIQILDAVDKDHPMSFVHPMINKGTAMVHPVGPSKPRMVMNRKKVVGSDIEYNNIETTYVEQSNHLSVVIGHFDLYKYLINKVIGDIFSY